MRFFVIIFLCANAYAIPKDINKIREMYQKPPIYWEKPNVDKGLSYEEISALPLSATFPKNNPYSKEKARLGKQLFYDTILSLDKNISCGSCHKKEFAFADNSKLSYGHNQQAGYRNTPSIAMSAYGREKFWDGRAKDIESQALFPIKDKKEMALPLDVMLKRLNSNARYQKEFKKVFGKSPIDIEQVKKALGTYERTLLPKHTRFDKFLLGELNALSDEEIWGLHLFRTKAKCMNCHYGVAFSDDKYHNLGLSYYGRKHQDLGRYELTKDPQDVGKFKTPTLRGISKTAPYMHNGLFPSLKGILNAYNAGMFHLIASEKQKNDVLFPKTSPLLHPLFLNKEELKAIEAFLKTL